MPRPPLPSPLTRSAHLHLPHHQQPRRYHHRALFHTTAAHRLDDHYQTLQLTPSATAADIKKQYYALSKAHHPDHNPNDSAASARFVEISTAYAVLGDASKRELYDRDLRRSSPSSSFFSSSRRSSANNTATTATAAAATGAPSGPAGGRPASGLSKRRTHFKGPPPSFYRSGGWGAHGVKRRAEAETASAAAARAASASASAAGDGGAGGAGGTGFGDGLGAGVGGGGAGFGNDVPHFDHEGHLRTQERGEQRRRRRMAEGYGPVEPEGAGLWGNFFFISAVLAVAIGLPSLVAAAASQPAGRRGAEGKRGNRDG